MNSSFSDLEKPLRIVSVCELLSTESYESGERLERVIFHPKTIEVNTELISLPRSTADVIFVRSSVKARLIVASQLLAAEGLKLIVLYGWRDSIIQSQLFFSQLRLIRSSFPKKRMRTAIEETHQFIAYPRLAGHPTGGAVDVTIGQVDDHIPLDMGSRPCDFSATEYINTFSDKISNDQFQNRMTLRRIMRQTGFTPFDGEWWHFSFGDREWAALTGNVAKYEPIRAPSEFCSEQRGENQ